LVGVSVRGEGTTVEVDETRGYEDVDDCEGIGDDARRDVLVTQDGE
jgi:hypothetical protein